MSKNKIDLYCFYENININEKQLLTKEEANFVLNKRTELSVNESKEIIELAKTNRQDIIIDYPEEESKSSLIYFYQSSYIQ